MSLKFDGSREKFIELLEQKFPNGKNLGQVGHSLRYTITEKGQNININLFQNGTVSIQPPQPDIEKILDNMFNNSASLGTAVPTQKKQVFVVYGHNEQANKDIELVLRRKKDIKTFIAQEEDSKGKTIIEFLTNAIPQSDAGIVLLTGDD